MGKEIKLNSTEWRDIIFEGKNHKYGAYYLRGSSSKRHIVAFFVVLIFVACVAAIPSFLDAVKSKKDKISGVDEQYAMVDLAEPEPETPEVIPPEDTPKPPPLKESIQFTPPVITEDTKVKEDKEMKTVEELNEKKDVQISIATVDEKDANKDGKDIADVLKEQRDVTASAVETPFTSVEQMPAFPGGNSALMSYVSKNLKYPTIAAQNGIQGRVVIRFVVTKDGSISDVTVLRSLDASCDREAVRVVQSMPKWIPGKQNGRAVPVYFTLPVVFKLQN